MNPRQSARRLAGFMFLQSTLLNLNYRCGRAAPLLRKVLTEKHPATDAKNRRGVFLLRLQLQIVCIYISPLFGWSVAFGSASLRFHSNPRQSCRAGGVLFLRGCLGCFCCRRDHGRRWFVCPKNDTPLAFLFSLAGCSHFQ